MKSWLKITGLILLGLVIFCYAGFVTSRYKANRIADNIMRPLFAKGWYHESTTLRLGLNGEKIPTWLIQYNNHTVLFDDFGPQFIISWSGQIRFMSPQDLVSQIEDAKNGRPQPK